ncbi:MAG: polysaccharide export protein [Acetobacteraceae bacterium]|nr:polysaccharide export protein [Acetobacteraceae bacterium]
MRLLLFLLVFPLLAGCAPGRDLPNLGSETPAEFRLGPGDTVRLITYGEDQLTGEFRVGDSGIIAVPLLGSVRAGGLTPAELEHAVADAFTKSNLLQEPSVSAEVIAYRPVFVLGEVNKPGQYPYLPGMTVVTAAAVAGGFTYRAVEDYVSVTRTTNGRSIEGKATRHDYVQPGDVITVFERHF